MCNRLFLPLFVTRAMIASHHEAKSKEALKRVRRLLSKSRLGAEVAVRVGEPAETIVNFARRNRCAEIVMGTRGLGSFKGLFPRFHHHESHSRSESFDNGGAMMGFRPRSPEN